jgi:hypothetical protein
VLSWSLEVHYIVVHDPQIFNSEAQTKLEKGTNCHGKSARTRRRMELRR